MKINICAKSKFGLNATTEVFSLLPDQIFFSRLCAHVQMASSASPSLPYFVPLGGDYLGIMYNNTL